MFLVTQSTQNVQCGDWDGKQTNVPKYAASLFGGFSGYLITKYMTAPAGEEMG